MIPAKIESPSRSHQRAIVLASAVIALFLSFSAETVNAYEGNKFFRVKQENGRWWFIDPNGERFFSKGVCGVQYWGKDYRGAVVAEYGPDKGSWCNATFNLLQKWGFNTLAAWADPDLVTKGVNGKRFPYALVLNLSRGFYQSQHSGAGEPPQGQMVDFFEPAFADYCVKEAQNKCAPLQSDTALIGYFTDNEPEWGNDWSRNPELLIYFLNLPPGSPGRTEAISVLKRHYKQLVKMNNAWGTSYATWDDIAQARYISAPKGADRHNIYRNGVKCRQTKDNWRAMAFIDDCDLFLNVLAHRYFKVCRDAIKAADPNHLLLGDKDASPPPQSVIEAEQAHMDVLSVDLYYPDPRKLIERYAPFNKPVLISEFGFKAEDSGCRNTGAGRAVPTQQDRARVTRQFLEYALQEPCLVGYHWFELIDQYNVTTDANYGLVSKHNAPYQLVINTLRQMNSEADKLRR